MIEENEKDVEVVVNDDVDVAVVAAAVIRIAMYDVTVCVNSTSSSRRWVLSSIDDG